ncbi:hypothetical protein Dimus_008501, partial [Dionaea muscipula]
HDRPATATVAASLNAPALRDVRVCGGQRRPKWAVVVEGSGVLRGVRVPILDGDRASRSMLPVRGELPDGAYGVQLGLPCRGADAALYEGRVQWDRGVGFQFGAQRGHHVVVREFLCEGTLEEEQRRGTRHQQW